MRLTQGYHIVPFKAQKDGFFLFYETQIFFNGHTEGQKLGAHVFPLVCPQNMATLF